MDLSLPCPGARDQPRDVPADSTSQRAPERHAREVVIATFFCFLSYFVMKKKTQPLFFSLSLSLDLENERPPRLLLSLILCFVRSYSYSSKKHHQQFTSAGGGLKHKVQYRFFSSSLSVVITAVAVVVVAHRGHAQREVDRRVHASPSSASRTSSRMLD